MKKSKLGKFIVLGALVGGALSLLDRGTREVVKERTDRALYYAKNPSILKEEVEEQVNKWSSIYEQASGEIASFAEQFSDLKELTPQVKQMVVEAKEAFVDQKE
ncbi:YtxH domain-containing protein [Savagea sp. SN6]|uniref:YtxH domain-containing protein n=1 Tax=Savagea serpentis TaxID=2785297 RepID=A0A8J7GAA7_9BACL|nr:YtxH domain-containing protein [Savagea serpentis]MBF4502188.1 YtxH domain-containing protein [Savagea serpentis]